MSAANSKLVVYAAAVGNGLIALTKFGAALYTGSSAMFSEAVHSVADTGNQLLLLYGMHRADRPPDEAHRPRPRALLLELRRRAHHVHARCGGGAL